MTKLKPCPFCGGEAILHVRINRPHYVVNCENTKCCGHNYILFYTKKEAIKSWNYRKESESES